MIPETTPLDLVNVNVYNYVEILKGKEAAMSITLSIPPAVVQEARAYAAENGTTMSRMIREYFIGLVTQRSEGQDGGSCRFLELAKSADVHLPRGWRFNRSECYERPVAK